MNPRILRVSPLLLVAVWLAVWPAEGARAEASPSIETAPVAAQLQVAAAETPPVAAAGLAPACPEDTGAAAAPVGEDTSIQGRLKGAVASGNLIWALLLVFVGGFLTALSPCVYPLIPITLSIFGARQAASHFQGFLLAATYVSGMVILYAGLGVGFAAAGFLAGSALQSPYITIGVALLCLAMAASMFGAFEMVLPTSLQTRLSQAGGSGFKGAFIMGLVAGIIAAPCTGPVLSFVLTLIARDGDVAKGGIMMVAYALGMGMPFLVLGTFSQAIARVPKSGKWMETVKGVFGLMMIGAGLYFLRLGVPAVASFIEPLGHLAILGPALFAMGLAAGALHLSFKMSPVVEKVRKSVGVTLAVTGIASFLAWVNAEDKPVSTEPSVAWVVVKNEPDAVAKFDAALAEAQAACKPVMIDFFAEWCIACKELDKLTYVDDGVKKDSRRFVSIKVDATEESEPLAQIQSRFGVVGLPTIAFIDGRGTKLVDPKVTGFLAAPEYVEVMKRVR
jgi:thioredoxin:protein disulfide reductase